MQEVSVNALLKLSQIERILIKRTVLRNRYICPMTFISFSYRLFYEHDMLFINEKILIPSKYQQFLHGFFFSNFRTFMHIMVISEYHARWEWAIKGKKGVRNYSIFVSFKKMCSKGTEVNVTLSCNKTDGILTISQFDQLITCKLNGQLCGHPFNPFLICREREREWTKCWCLCVCAFLLYKRIRI